jgi:hypothetical protein
MIVLSVAVALWVALSVGVVVVVVPVAVRAQCPEYERGQQHTRLASRRATEVET